ncbi:MAG: DUF1854 domain-containing protein [candidate division KSB1 bacterium]|nr:DUF1854 domain-containing protein [candidate division KSB1 bacterium]MDZ7275917.1 DUF1854 domain-containing protein [candidate division KSB1 bacterium]MDZ7285801.1 DUF1854 domain-containing protein [candidate division KSB1 bacterium]MDZ7298833.1 DUF1854 domain-containing protein [candidate division KSB1 bacterium]MDZ7308866.1 DUF1854 domain-containing protein [candidate division KSB1 bacterium]
MTDVLAPTAVPAATPAPAITGRQLALRRREDGRLVVLQPEAGGKTTEVPVQLAYCFPWSHPRQFISLRDDQGRELLLLESLQEVEAHVRHLLEEELAARNFLVRVLAIKAVSDHTELFHWQVVTTAGERSFLTRRHERPRRLATGEVLIKDVYNDLYLIARADDLDAKSLRLLWVYLD